MTANVTTKFNVWNELARASAHAAAQGGFAVVQGGNFWQGAAAGFVGSLAGSFSQGAGLQGWGMVGVSTAMGGVGVAIAGGKAEDILFGMVSGAMVGVLNHMQGEKEERKVNIAMRDKKDLITTPHLEVDVHSTITQDNQNSNITIVKDAESNNLVEVQMPGYSLNTDGSLTVGPSFFQVGSDFRNYVLNLSVPVGTTTNYGITLKFNSDLLHRILITAGSIFVLRRVPAYKPNPVPHY